jgi:large subunit ribosomal protein L21
MYAVIETGGKQFRVEPGDVIDVELTPVSGKKTQKVKFDRILLVGDDKGVKVGAPVVSGAEVTGVLVDEVRGPKIRVFKMKRRKGYRRTRGHRQDLLRVKIEDIKAGRASTTKTKAQEETEKEAEA